METAVDVAVVALVVARDRLDYGARFVRGGRVVEVHQRLAVHQLVQHREIGTKIAAKRHE